MATVYGGIGAKVARMVGQHPIMDQVAAKVAARAQAEAAAHEDPRTSTSIQISVERVAGKRGVTDRMVVARHPAMMHIEFGHATRQGTKKLGPVRWVPGLHIMTRAAKGVR